MLWFFLFFLFCDAKTNSIYLSDDSDESYRSAQRFFRKSSCRSMSNCCSCCSGCVFCIFCWHCDCDWNAWLIFCCCNCCFVYVNGCMYVSERYFYCFKCVKRKKRRQNMKWLTIFLEFLILIHLIWNSLIFGDFFFILRMPINDLH